MQVTMVTPRITASASRGGPCRGGKPGSEAGQEGHPLRPSNYPTGDLPGSALLGMSVSWEDTEMGGDPPRLKDETYE